MPLDLATVPCLSDNYAYLVHDPETGATAVADAPETAPILATLAARGWQLTDILITHHHHDHVGGVDALRDATGARVWGAALDAHRLPRLDRAVEPGRDESFGGESVEIFHVPGHTLGHIAYFFSKSHILFSGDSLMALGCGRLFEGDAAQMLESMTRLAGLPDDTIVCSGHEYAQTNARFARGIEPNNPELRGRAQRIDAARAAGQPTLPTRLAEERATNPFLRAATAELRAVLDMATATDVEVFAHVRRLRDGFS